jgi:acyl carrier protein
VEGALRVQAGVREAVVAVRAGVGGDIRLVAFITRDEGGGDSKDERITTVEMRERLRESLPDYMIPVVLVELKEMPLTASGKIDRKALPEVEGVQPESKAEYVAPETEIAAVLEDIWRRVLRIERIGVLDNFFDLGVDSLLATQLVAQVNSSFRIELPLRASFDNPNIRAMAGIVERVLIEQLTEQSLSDSQV